MPAAMPGQPSLFGVEASDPTPEDLAGLLAGPGELGRMGGTARVSVTVDAGWRVHVLVAELTRRGLPAGWEPVPDRLPATGLAAAGFTVRTAYTTRLLALAAAWRDGPPAGLHLNGPALRLWVAAAGTPSADGFLLRLGSAASGRSGAESAVKLPSEGPAASGRSGAEPAVKLPSEGPAASGRSGAEPAVKLPIDSAASEPGWSAVGAALSAAGLAAALVVPGPAGVPGPVYRITGRRRLARLAELVGDPPPAAPPGAWPDLPGRS